MRVELSVQLSFALSFELCVELAFELSIELSVELSVDLSVELSIELRVDHKLSWSGISDQRSFCPESLIRGHFDLLRGHFIFNSLVIDQFGPGTQPAKMRNFRHRHEGENCNID